MGFITYLMKNQKITLLFLIFYQLEFNEEWKELDLQNTAILERMKKVVSFCPYSFDPKLFSNTCKIANGKEKKATITCAIQLDHVNFQYVFAYRKIQFLKKKKVLFTVHSEFSRHLKDLIQYNIALYIEFEVQCLISGITLDYKIALK